MAEAPRWPGSDRVQNLHRGEEEFAGPQLPWLSARQYAIFFFADHNSGNVCNRTTDCPIRSCISQDILRDDPYNKVTCRVFVTTYPEWPDFLASLLRILSILPRRRNSRSKTDRCNTGIVHPTRPRATPAAIRRKVSLHHRILNTLLLRRVAAAVATSAEPTTPTVSRESPSIEWRGGRVGRLQTMQGQCLRSGVSSTVPISLPPQGAPLSVSSERPRRCQFPDRWRR